MEYDGLTEQEVADRLKAPSCLVFEKVTSTLDVVHQIAGDGAPEGSLVLANEQVQGRGRLGRSWSSPPGIGIWLGYLFRPTCSVTGGIVSIRAGIAVVKTLDEMGIRAELKWPNDIFMGGQKLCGVLCEVRGAGTVNKGWIGIGLGINVYGGPPNEVSADATYLAAARSDVSRMAVLEPLVRHLCRISDEPVLSDSEKTLYEERNWLLGMRLREPQMGTVTGIDHDGALLLKTENGIERVFGGTVVPD